jgi:peroxiredoxin
MSNPTIRLYLKIFLALVMAAPILVLAACASPSQTQTQKVNLNKPAPDFILKDLNGNLVALSNFRGKPVYFNYWATWCPACIKEMPIIQKVYEDWSKRGLELFTVDSGESLATVQDFMQKNHYTFPVLLDTQNDVGDKYKVYYIPVSVFVDKTGNIKNQVVGAFENKAAIEKILSPLVNYR